MEMNEKRGIYGNQNKTIIKSGRGITINPCQRGNPVIGHIRNVSWEFGDTIADYEIGIKVGILYLSLKYHKMHSNYIYDRLKNLKRAYQSRILILHIDGKDFSKALRELGRVSTVLDYCLVLAWSYEEAGKYIETFKMFEFKSADSIKERIPNNFMDQITACLTEVESISKTNVLTLALNFSVYLFSIYISIFLFFHFPFNILVFE